MDPTDTIHSSEKCAMCPKTRKKVASKDWQVRNIVYIETVL